MCVSNLLSAFAPSLATLTALQILTRAFVNSTFTVAAIAAVEEAPEGARAFSTAMLGLAGGFGFSFAVLTLPIADQGRSALMPSRMDDRPGMFKRAWGRLAEMF